MRLPFFRAIQLNDARTIKRIKSDFCPYFLLSLQWHRIKPTYGPYTLAGQKGKKVGTQNEHLLPLTRAIK